MSTSRDCCEDLIARARRGGLSNNEQRQFRDLLESSQEARLLYEASCAFDREASVIAGDDARLERIARQLQQRQRRHKRGMPVAVRTLSLGIAAGLLGAGIAAAAVNYSKASRPSVSQVSAGSAIARSRVVAPACSATARLDPPSLLAPPSDTPIVESPPRTAPVEVASVEPFRVPKSSVPRGPDLPAQPARTVADVTREAEPSALTRVSNHATARFDDAGELPVPTTTALALFTEANRARVQGNTTIAIARYEQLISGSPLSRLALAARISLGMLYLQQGRASQALEQFRSYDSSAGPLMAEALWGEAQASRALGQRASERGALQRIIREYPQSAYASAAQSRLSVRE